MPTARKQRVLKRQKSRRGLYILVAIVVIVTLAGVGWYIYASAQSAALNAVVYAKLSTTQGQIEVELYQGRTPKTVANFVSLAQSGFYINLVWHRIAHPPDVSVIQTGDPYTRDGGGNRTSGCCVWGTGGSSQTVPLEIDSSLHNYAFTLGMARGQDKNSGTSQFYINTGDNTNLDGNYTIFGKVIAGMSTVTSISNLPVNSSEQPLDPVPFLLNVTISKTA